MNLCKVQRMRIAVLGVLLGVICVPFVGAQTQTAASITVLGGEQSTGSVWDSGTFTVTLNGNVAKVVPYGQFSTTNSIAAGIAALFSRECYGVASAKADGATITFHLRYPGSSISITGGSQRDTAHFSNDSFYLSSQQNFSPSQISLAGDAGGEAVSPGTVIHLAATLAQSGASGTVSFYDNGVVLGTSALNGTAASFATPALAVGSHSLYAKYNGDSTYAGSTSNTVYATATNHTGPPSGSSPYWYTITDSSSNSGYSANGNIVAYNDAVMGRWSLGYNALNQLISANAVSVTLPSSAGPYFCWSYDNFGNRLRQSYSTQPFAASPGAVCQAGSAPISGEIASTYDPSNNNQLTRIQSSATPIYDRSITYSSSVTTGQPAGGYISNDGLNLYLYDGEGRVCAAQSPALISGGPPQMTQYIYDAEGQRVAKRNVSSWTCDLSQPSSGGSIYIAGQMTELSFDSNGTATWVHTNVSAGGALIATYQNDNGGTSPVTGDLHFALNDWLGTKRMQTSYNGTVENQWSSLPFGDGLVSSAPDATEHHFTGKERDNESGLDYFGARYYGSWMGRWVSPDYSMNSVILEAPQSWNKYSYVLNRPLYAKDPDGRCPWCIGAAVGLVAEGGFDLGKQLYHNGGDFTAVNYREVGANALGGAVAGALAVATGGASLVESALVGDIAAGGTANIVGGIVTRAAQGDGADEVLSGSEVFQDAIAGFVGGGAGHLAGDVVHVPDDPIRPDPRHQARTSVYKARKATRNRLLVSQGVRAGFTSSAGVHLTNGGFSFFDWLLFSSPPSSNPNHPNEHVTVTIYFDPDQKPITAD